ncbi:hypothetical protein JMM59_11760 [Rhodovulum sulfidophilum]|uniref:hypothetical protein n=1 Tax=Rhodovulum sulfidophilum TaxID=35806 RepID=UPI0019228A8C|nr:hypothetical protein [Rhodovulum sulfidophilum]MBL3565675.1 hypothetical protein [Rhodovulum sulfidophilum]
MELNFSAAALQSTDHFALAAVELEYDAPFSAVLVHRPALSQPWERIDIERTIVALTFSGADLMALSDEGDIYRIGSSIERSKIEGAGVSSSDADGRGRCTVMCTSGNKLWVAGENGQLYANVDGISEWAKIALNSKFQAVALLADGDGGVFLVGDDVIEAISPAEVDYTNPQAILDALRVDRDTRQQAGPTAHLYHISADLVVSELSIPDCSNVRGLASYGSGEVGITGVDGLFLKGKPRAGLFRENLGLKGQTLLCSAAAAQGIVIGTDSHWYVFDGATVEPLRLGIAKHTARLPLSVYESAGSTVLFDCKMNPLVLAQGIWSDIEVPSALRKREFDMQDFLQDR